MMMFGIPGWMEMFTLVAMMGGAGIPLGVPPADEDRLMSLVAPQECIYYTTWAATDTPDASSKNHTEQLLAEKEVQAFIGHLEKSITTGMKRMSERGNPMGAMMGELVPKWGKVLLTHATCIYVSKIQIGLQGPEIDAGLIINTGRDKAAELVATLQFFTKEDGKKVEIDGGTYHQIQPAPKAPVITFGARGRYFVVALGKDGLQNM
ncbi:MAG: hypothetical protein IH991_24215, partial [Planctomycetes bacterium]|nr:hypothetical protein [Planctomycetota bacterium]